MIIIEETGRKVQNAINNGLARLGKSLGDVEIEIIDHGGLFRKAKVRIKAEGDDFEFAGTKIKSETLEKKVEPNQKAPQQQLAQTPKTQNRQPKTEQPQRAERSQRTPERTSPQERTESFKKPERTRSEDSFQERRFSRPYGNTEEPKKEHEVRKISPITPEIVDKAEKYLTTLLEKMGVQGSVKSSIVEDELHLDLAADSGVVIGYHGEVLTSIEYLVSYHLNNDPNNYYRVAVDSNNYREKRRETLIELAKRKADLCIRKKHKIVLDPMNSGERKIIHSALADNDRVITRSEGHEPNRHVIIFYKMPRRHR